MIKNKHQQLRRYQPKRVKRKANTEADYYEVNGVHQQNQVSIGMRKINSKNNVKTIQSDCSNEQTVKKSLFSNFQLRNKMIQKKKQYHILEGSQSRVRQQIKLNTQKIAINGKTLNKHLKSHQNEQYKNSGSGLNNSSTVQTGKLEQYKYQQIRKLSKIINRASFLLMNNQKKEFNSLVQSPSSAVRNFVDRQILKDYANKNHRSQQKLRFQMKVQQGQANFFEVFGSNLNEQEDQNKSSLNNTNKLWKFRKYFNQKYNGRNHSRKTKEKRINSQGNKNIFQSLSINNHIYALCRFRNVQIVEALNQQAKNPYASQKFNKISKLNRQKQRRVSQFGIVDKDAKQINKQYTIQPWEVY